MRIIILLMVILISMLTGCTNDHDSKIDFTTWDEEKVYAFLNEVHQYVREIPLETKSKEKIIKKYNKYFDPELSEKIFESLYIKNDKGWKVPDGDGGYIFIVPEGEYEGSEVQIEFQKDFIKIRETYEIGMYTAIDYIIRYNKKTIISEWKYE